MVALFEESAMSLAFVSLAAALALVSLGGGVYEFLAVDPFWPTRPDQSCGDAHLVGVRFHSEGYCEHGGIVTLGVKPVATTA
jgi:hypothetical protein